MGTVKMSSFLRLVYRSGYFKTRKSTTTKLADRRKRHRAKMVSEVNLYKLKYGCASCGECSLPEILDLHHPDPSMKLGTVNSLIRSHGLKAVLNELKKCIVLCANCHRKHHSRSRKV